MITLIKILDIKRTIYRQQVVIKKLLAVYPLTNLKFMFQREIIGFIILVLFLSCSNCSENIADNNKGEEPIVPLVGKTLPDWEEGYLDIHAINTGRGESTLYVFPDGTSLLADAAGSLLSSSAEIPPTPAKPNSTISSGQVIINYLQHFLEATGNDKLNYILISHFHPDHIGSYSTSLPLAPNGSFRIGGITEVGGEIPFETIIDRGYPDYDYPTDISATDLMSNYIEFINWAETSYNATAQQFEVGVSDQIVLRNNPLEYANFEIRNIVANGEVWTGNGAGSANTFPSTDELVAAGPNENIFSIGFHLSYGLFNYFAGGDLQYNGMSDYSWKDIETPVANVMTSVDLLKANHHGTANCNGSVFLNKLAPQAVIIHSWRDVQPNPETIGRMFEANVACKIFTTNMTDANKERLAVYMSRIQSTQGHIVVRVAPNGLTYTVYILEDTNEEYKVKKIFGPYQSS